MRSLTFTASLLLVAAASTSFCLKANRATTAAGGKPQVLRVNKEASHAPGRQSLFMARHGDKTTSSVFGPHDAPVGGSIWPVSIYWTTVQIGTPPRSFAAAIDSGSGELFISGEGCQGCVTTPPNVAYNPNVSSTSEAVKPPFNTFEGTYATCNPTHPLQPCTVTGYLYTDEISLAGFGPTRVGLGAIQTQTSNFYQFHTIDGVMGMIGNSEKNPFYKLCVEGDFCPEPTWGICMHDGIFSNGTITIGGVDESLAVGPIQYVNSPNTSFFHSINVQSIDFSAPSSSTASMKVDQHAILDTGTNDILIPGDLFDSYRQTTCAYFDQDSSEKARCDDFFNKPLTCHNMTQAEMDKYPSMTFNLDNNVQLEITPKDYFLKHSPAATESSQYCFGLSNGGGYFIIGDTLMQNYYLVFKESQVGWGKVNKDTCGSK